jgi:chorismate mutase/prephenate dehydrogenase
MTDSKNTELDALRTELDRIDRELVERAAERQRIVSEIGRIKKSAGRSLRDFRRERQVLDGVRAAGRGGRAGPGPRRDPADGADRGLVDAPGNRARGRIGPWCRGGRRWSSADWAGWATGWRVSWPSRAGAWSSPIRRWSEPSATWQSEALDDAPKDAELIVLAAPIQASADLLDDLIERGPEGLVLDLASVKGPLIEPLRAGGVGGPAGGVGPPDVRAGHAPAGRPTRAVPGLRVLRTAVDEARALFDRDHGRLRRRAAGRARRADGLGAGSCRTR